MIRAGIRRTATSALLALLVVGIPSLALAGDAPYVVRGNNHIIVGVSLDEAAVRAALPAGLKPTKDITGGYNVYRSEGGYNNPPYTRAYVWVDLEGHDSANGSKARWVLWGVTGPGAEKSRAAGYEFHDGSAALVERGATITGTAEQNGARILRVEIKRGDGGCKPVAGMLNYPVKLPSSGKMVMHQYPFAGEGCGAAPVALEVLTDKDHPLARFKPTKLLWAIQAKNLSFAGTTTAFK